MDLFESLQYRAEAVTETRKAYLDARRQFLLSEGAAERALAAYHIAYLRFTKTNIENSMDERI